MSKGLQEEYEDSWNAILDTLIEHDREDLVDFLEMIKNKVEDGEFVVPPTSSSEEDEDEDGCVAETIEVKEDEKGFFSLK